MSNRLHTSLARRFLLLLLAALLVACPSVAFCDDASAAATGYVADAAGAVDASSAISADAALPAAEGGAQSATVRDAAEGDGSELEGAAGVEGTDRAEAAARADGAEAGEGAEGAADAAQPESPDGTPAKPAEGNGGVPAESSEATPAAHTDPATAGAESAQDADVPSSAGVAQEAAPDETTGQDGEGDAGSFPAVASSGTESAQDVGSKSSTARPAASASASADLPSRFDARTTGIISAVRLQDPWGSCWAFGSLAAMEANLAMQGLIDPEEHLSARHLVYFAGTPVGSEAKTQAGEGQHPSEDLLAIYGENAVFELGGHALEVASAISSGEGVVLETAYPYGNDEGYLTSTGLSYSTDGTWALDGSARYESAYTLREMLRFPNPATYVEGQGIGSFALDTDALSQVKQAIIDYGAVSVSYRSYRTSFDSYTHFDAENATFFTNTSRLIDHDVCIVGWIDDFPREKFTTGRDGTLPEGDGAWIVKNSWGATSSSFPDYNIWGEDGYCYLSYYDRSTQGFTAWDMMAAQGAGATSVTDQYDYMGQRSNSETRVSDFRPQSYANIFTANQNQALRAVSVNTYAPNTKVSVEVYLLPSEGTGADPTAGELVATKQLTVDWSGYHRIDLDAPALLRSGQRFAVVVSQVETDAAGNAVPVASIEAGNNVESMATYGLTHYDTVIVNEGETSILADLDEDPSTPSLWIDGVRFAELLHERAVDGAYFGNANIKAFSDYYTDPDAGSNDNPQPDPAPAPPADWAAQPASGSDTGSDPAASSAPAAETGAAYDPAQAPRTPAVPSVRAAAGNVAAAPASATPATGDGATGTLAFLLLAAAISGCGLVRFGNRG